MRLVYPSIVLIRLGEGFMYHVTRVSNRESIREDGLDWGLMRAAGIAGSTEPELPGIFLCAAEEDADFFVGMAGEAVDVWRVRVDGLWLEDDPGAGGGDNWMVVPEPIEASRLELLRSGVLRVWGDV